MPDTLADFGLQIAYALDPAFETLHPRGSKGQWADKPGTRYIPTSQVQWPTTDDLPNHRLAPPRDRSEFGGAEQSSAAWLSPSGQLFRVVDSHDDWATGNLGVDVFKAINAGGIRLDRTHYGSRVDLNVEATLAALRNPTTAAALEQVVRNSEPFQGYAEIVLDLRAPEEFLTFDGKASFFAALHRMRSTGNPKSRSQVAQWHPAEEEAAVFTLRTTFAVDPDFESKHPRGPGGTPQGGKFIEKPDSGAPTSTPRGEVGMVIDAKTGEVLLRSDVGRPVAEDWQSNVDLQTNTFQDRDIILVHTHPDQMTFSDGDWVTLVQHNVREVQVVLPDGQVHTIRKPDDFDWKRATPRKVREGWERFENDIFDSGRSLDMTVEQITDEINLRLADMTGIEFSKTRPLHSAAQAGLKAHAEGDAVFSPHTTFAVDPEFETKHPRDPQGQWADKPGRGTATLDAPEPNGFSLDAQGKYVGTLPANIWPTMVELNAQSHSIVYAFGKTLDLVVDTATGRAAFSETKDHGPMIRELDPEGGIDRTDAYAKVTLLPSQAPTKMAEGGPGYITIVPPWLHTASSEAERAQSEYRAVRTVLRLLYQSGVPEDLKVQVSWGSTLNAARAKDSVGRGTSMFAVDPEFETQHPRDPKGQWAEKPGGPEPNVPGGSSTPTPDPQQGGFEAMRQNMIERFGMTPEQASAQIEGMQQLTARLAGPTKATPTKAQAAGTHPNTRYPGQCYEMAGRYMLDRAKEPDENDYTLVHGVIDQSPFGDMRIGHGWIETADGKVFDATTQEWSEKESYYKTFNAVSEQRYSAREARRMIFSKKNWGCWYASAGVVNNQTKTPRPSRRRAKVAA